MRFQPFLILLLDSFLFFVGVRRIGRYHLLAAAAHMAATATNSYINIYRAIVRPAAPAPATTSVWATDCHMPPVFWLLI